jgi:aspartate/methionine/tyrosine aminotransferase
VINSFSKFFGMTGWRLGWCVLPDGLVEAAERLAMNYFLCASTPAQIAAVECFSDESLAECEQRRLELLQRRQIVLEGLQRLGLRVPVPPNGAFYVYFDVSSTGLDAWTFCERALNEAHVALTPGRDFGAETADTHVRLSYASSQADLHEGMRRLEAFVAGLPGSAANPEGR